MVTEARVTLVSGGSRGLGQALVQDRLAAGDIVATFSRTPTAFMDRERDADPVGERFYWEAVDGTDIAGVSAFASRVMQKYRRIDTLINNAGIGVDGLLTMTSPQDIHRALTLNLEAVITLTRQCLKGMLQARSGCIINISSVNAARGHSGLSVYSATKAALQGLTRSLAKEVGPQNIRVNSIAPGFFESEMVRNMTSVQRERILRRTPLGALCTLEDLVETARFLIGARSITGQTIVVDGGFSC
jgi:3-oxoacyl-[acyl-carrier protein] reductase